MHSFYETVFLGGGISCLAAARSHQGDAVLLEREDRVGGLCRSEKKEGFIFDRTGHLLHLHHSRARRLICRLLRGNLVFRARNSWIFSHGVYTRYPFQSHFYGLPPEVVADCLLGYLHSRKRPRGGSFENFADWVMANFGSGVARHFMFPYNRKLWTVSPGELTTEWLERFVPQPDLREVVLGALTDKADSEGYNAGFRYPLRGGIESLVQALSHGVRKIVTGVSVVEIELRSRRLRLSTGDRVAFGRLVSCAPLPELVGMIRPVPDGVKAAASKLRWSSVYNLNLGIRDPGDDRHWVYVPERHYSLYRFGYSSNFCRQVAPDGAANVYTEVAYRPDRPPALKRVRQRVIRDLVSIGVIRSERDILTTQENLLPFAYAIYDRHRSRAVAKIRGWLEPMEIFPIGRYGRWEYSAMEDAVLQGLELGDRLRGGNGQAGSGSAC